jgi:hypothetical protein
MPENVWSSLSEVFVLMCEVYAERYEVIKDKIS